MRLLHRPSLQNGYNFINVIIKKKLKEECQSGKFEKKLINFGKAVVFLFLFIFLALQVWIEHQEQ